MQRELKKLGRLEAKKRRNRKKEKKNKGTEGTNTSKKFHNARIGLSNIAIAIAIIISGRCRCRKVHVEYFMCLALRYWWKCDMRHATCAMPGVLNDFNRRLTSFG